MINHHTKIRSHNLIVKISHPSWPLRTQTRRYQYKDIATLRGVWQHEGEPLFRVQEFFESSTVTGIFCIMGAVLSTLYCYTHKHLLCTLPDLCRPAIRAIDARYNLEYGRRKFFLWLVNYVLSRISQVPFEGSLGFQVFWDGCKLAINLYCSTNWFIGNMRSYTQTYQGYSRLYER